MEYQAISISQFCRNYGISRGTFYNLEKASKAPRTLQLGRRRVIPVAAVREWEIRNMKDAA